MDQLSKIKSKGLSTVSQYLVKSVESPQHMADVEGQVRQASNDLTALEFSRNSCRRDAVTVPDVQSRRHRLKTDHTVRLESTPRVSRMHSMRISVVVSSVRGCRRARAVRENLFVRNPHLLRRYQAICPLNGVCDRASKFIRDVDHHARACWWSTSESSEKCPRVTRGTMIVPSGYAFSSDLIGNCQEIVGALSHCVDYGKVRSRRRE
jgi:hypothetical protein